MRCLYWLVTVLALTSGCERPKFDTPVDAYLSFSKAVSRGDYKMAYTGLTERSQALLSERAKSIADASAGSVSGDPMAWFFSKSGRPVPVEKVEAVSQNGDDAKVRITTPDGSRELSLRKESGVWKLDLIPLMEGSTSL